MAGASSLVAIAGWVFQRSLEPSFLAERTLIAMPGAIAVLLITAAVMAGLVERGSSDPTMRRRMRLFGMCVGSLLVFFGGVVLVAHISGQGQDATLGGASVPPPLVQMHRLWPSPAVAASLTLAGISLLIWRQPRRLCLFSAVNGCLALVGWIGLNQAILGVRESSGPPFFEALSLPAALAWLLVALSLFCLRPMEGVARLFSSPNHAGDLVRWFTAVGALLMPALGLLLLRAQEHLHFTTGFGIAIHGAAMSVALALAGLRGAWLVERLAQQRHRAEQKSLRELAARQEALRRLEESEKRVAASEQRFRGIFNSAFNFIGLLAPDGTLLEANKTALDLIGAQPANVLGRSFAETPWWAHSAEERAKLCAGVERAARGELVRFETSHPDASGETHHVDFTLKPVLDASGRVAHLVPEGRDITDRKRAEQKQAWLATFPEHNPNPVVEFDPVDGRIYYSNLTMDKLLPDLRERGLQHPFLADFAALEQVLLSGEMNEVLREVEVNGLDFAQIIIYVSEARRFRVYASDITRRKQAEKALQTSEERYRSLFQHMLEGYCYCRVLREQGRVVDFIYLEVNSAFEPLTGLKDVVGKRISEAVPGIRETNPEIFETYERVTSSGQPERYETFLPGLGRWFSVGVYSPATDHFVAVFDNITERKQAAEALRASLEEFRTLAEALPQIVWMTRPDGWHIYFNQQWVDYTGLTFEESHGDGWNKPFHPDDQQRAREAWVEATTNLTTYSLECRLRRADGVYRWWLIRGEPLRDANGTILKWFGTCTDIHDLKLAEVERRQAVAQIEASEELLRQFIKSTPAAIAMLDTEMRYLQASDRWFKDYHFESREIIGRSHYEVFPDEPQRWKGIHQRVLGGAVERCEEDPFPRATGGVEWLQWEARPWRKAGGEIGGIVFYTQVITARKAAEAQMRESEERFRGAFENAPIGMAMVSLTGRWMRVNRAICGILGLTEAELLASTFQDITHPEDLDADLEQVRALISGHDDHYTMEKRYFHKSGRIVWVLLAVTILRSADGTPLHFVSQIKDITARREADERLRASLKEKEILLREIHHRVKNNLQVISSLLQLQSGYLRDPLDVAMFRECQARIHAMGLVHDRLYRSDNLSTIDFSEHLREMVALIVRGQSSDVERIRVVIESEPLEVNLDTAIPLGLITAELITNAYKHAFLGRPAGVITVRLTRTAESRLTLAVEDDGVGLPAGFEAQKARSLGLRLIRALAGQLHAEFFIASSEAGCKVSLLFQL